MPVDYSGDAMEVLARLKAASEGDWSPWTGGEISRLGAPFRADWRPYPESDVVLFWLVGVLANITSLYLAANLAVLGAHVLAGLSFYAVVRLLRARAVWAATGAVLFACSHYIFTRGLGHYSLSLAWTVPPALATCWLLARGSTLCRVYRWWMLGVAAALGLGNPYYLLLYLQLVLLAMLWSLFGRRNRTGLATGALCVGMAVGAAALQNGRRWTAAFDSTSAPSIVRDYSGTEAFALKPVELLVPPPTHRQSTLALLGRRYQRSTTWRTEWPSPYLGLVGIGGLGVLAFTVLARAVGRSRVRPPEMAWQVGWILLFATAGGLANFWALTTRLHLFRATNRYSVFLLAIALVMIVGWLTRRSRRWPTWAVGAAASGLLALGLWDQLPRPDPERWTRVAVEVESDREIVRELQERLPAGAALFQLPVLSFPEARMQNRMRDYEHFRPYLNSHDLRFSYGPLRRRARSQWQVDLTRHDPVRMVERLENAGFAGLYINRAAYPDDAAGLLSQLAAAGRTQVAEGKLGRQIVVLLRPSPKPVEPLADNLTWAAGWSNLPLPAEIRGQTAQRGVFTYYNPRETGLSGSLRLQLKADGVGYAQIKIRGTRKWHGRLDSNMQELVFDDIALPRGRTAIEIEAEAGGSLVWIKVLDLEWRISSP